MNKDYFVAKANLMTGKILGEKAKPNTFRNAVKIAFLTMVQKYYIRRSAKTEEMMTLN